jgi:integrase
MATLRKNGKNWQAIIRNKGFKSQSKSFPLRKDAAAWAKVIESQQIRGTFVDTETASTTSFADCLDRYESEQEAAGRRSIRQLKSQLNLIRQSGLIGLSLANVTPIEIVKYKDARMATGIKAATYIKDHNLLHAIFEVIQRGWAISLPKGNPVKMVSTPKHTSPTSRNRRLVGTEEKRLLAVLYESSYETAIIVKFALATGMRRGEIMNIRFGDVSPRAISTLTIPQTKTGHPRVIPLTVDAHSALSEQTNLLIESYGMMNGVRQNEFDRMFLFEIKPDSVTRAFKRACDKANIMNLTFHDLRHEAISRLFEKGLDMMEVSHISGHKGFDMLKKYTHLKPEDILKKLR